jgi:hypothetical protein
VFGERDYTLHRRRESTAANELFVRALFFELTRKVVTAPRTRSRQHQHRSDCREAWQSLRQLGKKNQYREMSSLLSCGCYQDGYTEVGPQTGFCEQPGIDSCCEIPYHEEPLESVIRGCGRCRFWGRGRMTGKPEVIGLSVGLVMTNAL